MTNELAAALRAYTGRDVLPFPQRDREAVMRQVDSVRGASLLAEVEQLFAELLELEPAWSSHSLASATARAKAGLRVRHPELDEDALATLAWAWSYDRR